MPSIRGLGAALLCAGAMIPVATAADGTMAAVVQHGYGGPEVLHLERIPVPRPGPGQVRIKVYAVGMNPDDTLMREGKFRLPGPPGAPATAAPATQVPGNELSGVIDAVGPGVTKFKVGEPVYSEIFGQGSIPDNGALAEYCLARVEAVARKPRSLTYAEAAGAPVSAETSQRGIEMGNIKAGDKVVIVGAAGGIGGLSVQLAKLKGAHVVAVASSRHNAYLRDLGADEITNYDIDGGAEVDRIRHTGDVVINTVTGQTAQAMQYTRPGGTFVPIAAPPPGRKECAAAGIHCAEQVGPSRHSMVWYLDEAARLADAGKLRFHVEKTYPMNEAAAAQDFVHAGHAEGKTVVLVKPDEADKR